MFDINPRSFQFFFSCLENILNKSKFQETKNTYFFHSTKKYILNIQELKTSLEKNKKKLNFQG